MADEDHASDPGTEAFVPDFSDDTGSQPMPVSTEPAEPEEPAEPAPETPAAPHHVDDQLGVLGLIVGLVLRARNPHRHPVPDVEHAEQHVAVTDQEIPARKAHR